MATRQELIDQIARDMSRTNIEDDIRHEIDRAIKYYQKRRFTHLNVSRDLAFKTIANQFRYSGTTTVLAPTVTLSDIIEEDAVYLERSDGQRYLLEHEDHPNVEYFTDSSASTGEPYWYSRYQNEFWLYPIPIDDSYTIRISGHYSLRIPESDTENNAWFDAPEQLIRCRAKHFLYAHKVHNPEQATLMRAYEQDALNDLLEVSNKKSGASRIKGSF